MPCDVVSVGLSCYDHLVQVPSFQKAAEGCYVKRVSVQGGGISATACVAAARLGAKAALYTRLGDDYFGRHIRDELVAFGVEVPLPFIPGAKSGACTVMVEEGSGERRFLYFPGEGLDESGQKVPLDEALSAKVLLVDGRWEDESLRAVHAAVERGVPVVADVGYLRPHEEEIVRLADYPLFSQVILGGLGVYPAEREQLARRVLKEGRAERVVFTLGDEGCEVYRRDCEVEEFPGFSVEVVDTTGAGDAFHGAFAFAVARGWEFERALELAQAVGALACRGFGGRSSLPALEEAVGFINEQRKR